MKKTFLIATSLLLGQLGFSAPATGTIDHVAWTFVSGMSRMNGNNIEIHLWNQNSNNPCTDEDSTFSIRAVFPGAVGSYNVDPNAWDVNIVVFSDMTTPGSPANNVFADSGTMKIATLTTSTVSGTINAKNTGFGSNVAGDFSVPLCAN